MQVQQCGAVSVVKPSGPLTQQGADDFKGRVSELITSSLGRVIVDTSAIPYVDSRGLESLVELADELAHGGHTLKLCGVNDTLLQVFSLTGVATRFEHFNDTNTAVRSFL
jgi:anti-sigma B factor antagonist